MSKLNERTSAMRMDEIACCSRQLNSKVQRRQLSARAATNPSVQLKYLDASVTPRQMLTNEWTFWYYEFKRGVEWNKCQHEISSFRTMEQFWTLHGNVKLASEINATCDYAFFKNGIRPMWEDDVNCRGGRWIIDIQKGYQLDEINALWTNILLALIGEHFYLAELLCGAVFSNRAKRTKIAVWMKYASNQAIQSVGAQIRSNFHIADDIPVLFEFHNVGRQF